MRILFFVLFIPVISLGQIMKEPLPHLNDAIEDVAQELNESGLEEVPDEILDLSRNPINLNKDDTEILVRYNLITNVQSDAIQNYRKINGDFVELEELQQIEELDKHTILRILPYCSVVKKVTSERSHVITLRTQKKLYDTGLEFPGPEYKILLRYKGNISNSLSVSYTGEKDEGEKIFTGTKPSFDFNSFHIAYKSGKSIKTIIAGDYNLEYGQGLTAWTGFGFGGGNQVQSIYRHGRGIIPYSGTDENRFLRGLAIRSSFRKLIVDAWFSYHPIDANIEDDTLNNSEYATSLQTSGYHRTESEIRNMRSQKEKYLGLSLNYSSGNLKLGFVSSFLEYDISISGNDQPYKKFSFKGNEGNIHGLFYTYHFKNIFLFGEGSFDKNNLAHINGMIVSLDSRLSMGILHRDYPVKFIPLKSAAFGKNTNNTNENGTYVGINLKIFRQLIYTSYMDVFSFPYIKYRVDKPSNGVDLLHQLDFSPAKKFNIQLRYVTKKKQINSSLTTDNINRLDENVSRSIRFSTRFKIDESWEYGFRVERSGEIINRKSSGSGSMISQDLFYHPMGKSFSINFRYAVYSCPDFNTRIYAYENDVPGAFSVPFYYGNGSKFYLNMSRRFMRNIHASIKYSVQFADDEEKSKPKSEIKIQLKTTFR